MTVQSSIIEHLLSLIDDRDLADRIRARYYQDVEAQTNFAQSQVFDIAMRLEQKFDEKVTTQFGATNEMVAEGLRLAKEGGVALRELRADFQTWAENIVDDIDALRDRIDTHEAEMASFRASRDASIAERKQLKEDLDESKADRVSIHTELSQAAAERQSIIRSLNQIKALLDGRPTNEEAQQLVQTIHDTKARLDALEARERGSNRE